MFQVNFCSRLGSAARMEFEHQARSVTGLDFWPPGRQFLSRKGGQSPVAFLRAPVILTESRQDRISQRQLHLGQIPTNKIRFVMGNVSFLEKFARQEQPRTTVKHETSGFGKR